MSKYKFNVVDGFALRPVKQI